MWDIVIPAIAGLITGTIGSMFAPWANWGVEKKRLQQTTRAKLIEEVRTILSDPPGSEQFRTLPIYSRIRPFLSNDTRKAVEGTFEEHKEEIIIVVLGSSRHSGVNPYVQDVLDELSALEIKWGLI